MNTDTLNTLVTSAIWYAEHLDDAGIDARFAWAEVSRVEEELARALPPSEGEGRLARSGAVYAALRAENFARAQTLADRYAAEEGSPDSLRAELREHFEENIRTLADRYSLVTRRYPITNARAVAIRLHQGGPFGLANAA